MTGRRMKEELEMTAMDLREGLAAAALGIQWTYAIFWSPSPRLPGMLGWGDGYYNGDIRTRKMSHPLEGEDDRIGHERSEQLKQLYVSLSAGDKDQLSRRPYTLLSPEDLTDSEWFYLLSMSFTFRPGHGLVGRTMAAGTHIWLTDAHSAESRVFARSLLAKSASIHTVFCCPFLNGALELGTTESVREDPDLIRRVTTFFWESRKGVSAKRHASNLQISMPDKGFDLRFSSGFHPLPSLKSSELSGEGDDGCRTLSCEEPEEASPLSPSYLVDFHSGESPMMDGPDGVSLSHSWQLMYDEPLSCATKQERNMSVNDPKVSCRVHFSAADAGIDDGQHYERTLFAIFGSSAPTGATMAFPCGSQSSSFVPWRKGTNRVSTARGAKSQILLKKILFDRSGSSQIYSERSNERLNKDLRILKTLLPSSKKVDKSSILGDTIEYLKELERRVEFLESHMNSQDQEEKQVSQHVDDADRTSDNYDKSSSICKRKAREADEPGFEADWVLSIGKEADVNVTIVGKEVVIQATCPWRDCLLLEVMEALSSLHLDALSVQSSTVGGNLSLTIKSKIRGGVLASPGMIKGKIHRVVCKC